MARFAPWWQVRWTRVLALILSFLPLALLWFSDHACLAGLPAPRLWLADFEPADREAAPRCGRALA